jgi:hypothetical protein
MNPDRQQALDYLRAPAHGLWRWAEQGTVVVWRDGSTVAFREEILQLLEWLGPNGLPPFGAVVFLLAACRGRVATVEDIVLEPKLQIPPRLAKDAAVLAAARRQLRAQLEVALLQLGLVAQLPSELHSGLKARCVLAEVVFEPARAERHVRVQEVLRGMQGPFDDAELVDPEQPSATGSYVRQIHIVAEGLKPHTAESLALRLRTGLDALPGAAAVVLTTAERARQLIEELSRDREVGLVARAARELLAAVRLPRRLGERDALALGGVADITNRGPLDRLLLSELAHDDLTLAVRVALNEALYLRREPPLREPPGTLALLLDSGVRLWGVPRVLAAAVALALVAADKQHCELRAWRAQGKGLCGLDLLTRKGLVEHLAALEVEAHPGSALPAFTREVAAEAHHQSVIITHPDALADPEFRRCLGALEGQAGFVATVDRAGRFELHALPLAHRAALCAAELDLEALFRAETAVALRRPEADPELPAILGLPVFPFLLPVAGKVDYWAQAADGYTYATLNDRRLVQFRDALAGARVLAGDLPPGRTLWLECRASTVFLLKAGARQRPARLVTVNAAQGSVRVTDTVIGEVLAAQRQGEVLLVIRPGEVCAYALSDGRRLGHKPTPQHWLQGRYFRHRDGFCFASWDGTEVHLEEVTLPRTLPRERVLLLFDREGMEGPWLLLNTLEVKSTATDEGMPLHGPGGLAPESYQASVSRDGHRLHLARQGPKWTALYDLKTGQYRNNPRLLAPVAQALDAPPALPTWNLYRVVESLTTLPGGLALCGRKGVWRKLGLAPDGRLRIGEQPSRDGQPALAIRFPAAAQPTRHGCTLQAADWPNGARVFLDSRGLLHFKSKDPSLPEVSLVLAQSEVAGWTSDGVTCGPAFFFGGARASHPDRVMERLQRILHL